VLLILRVERPCVPLALTERYGRAVVTSRSVAMPFQYFSVHILPTVVVGRYQVYVFSAAIFVEKSLHKRPELHLQPIEPGGNSKAVGALVIFTQLTGAGLRLDVTSHCFRYFYRDKLFNKSILQLAIYYFFINYTCHVVVKLVASNRTIPAHK